MRELLAPYGIEAQSAGELGLGEPDETGTTFAANARIKAQAAAKATGKAAFADDSGLVVEALGGEPGIHSARWAGPDKDFRGAMNRIQTLLIERGARAPEQRRAHFIAALCLAWPDGHRRGVRGPRRRLRGVAAARLPRLRLRPAVPAGRFRPHLRRDERRGETRPAAAGPGPVAPRAGLRETRGRLLAEAVIDYNFKHLSAAKTSACFSCGPPRPKMVNMTLPNPAPFAVYVHWPFCLSKCPYCDFNSHVRHGGYDEARYVRAIETRACDHGAARAGPHGVEHLLRRRHAVADAAVVGAGDPRRNCKTLERRARRRGLARGQSDQRRCDALPRLSRGRRQSRLARRAGARRRIVERARPPAHGARSARRRRRRALDLRPLLVRSDLCAAAADAVGVGGRAQARHRRSGRASVALSIDHRAGHAVLRPAQGRQADHSRRRSRARSLRPDAGGLRRCRPAGLRNFKSRAARRRVPAQSRLLARPRLRRRRSRRARAADHRRPPLRHRNREAPRKLDHARRGQGSRPHRRRGADARARPPTNIC